MISFWGKNRRRNLLHYWRQKELSKWSKCRTGRERYAYVYGQQLQHSVDKYCTLSSRKITQFACLDLKKLVNSTISNAERKFDLSGSKLEHLQWISNTIPDYVVNIYFRCNSRSLNQSNAICPSLKLVSSLCQFICGKQSGRQHTIVNASVSTTQQLMQLQMNSFPT